MSDPFVGEIRLFGFPRVPDGWVSCSGQSLAISQYETLFTLIGTTFGGDGNQNFNAPDLRGRVPIGQGTGQNLATYMIGQSGGEEQHTLIDLEMPVHSHAFLSSTTTATSAIPANSLHLATASTGNLYAPVASSAPYSVMAPCVGSAGGSVGHDNMMPTVVANYCICVAGVFPTSG